MAGTGRIVALGFGDWTGTGTGRVSTLGFGVGEYVAPATPLSPVIRRVSTADAAALRHAPDVAIVPVRRAPGTPEEVIRRPGV